MMTTGYQPKVATHCCVCGIELTDGTSIEFGIGPVCRKKYRYEDALPIDEATAQKLDVFMKGAHLYFPSDLTEKVWAAAKADDSRKIVNLLIYHASAEQGLTAVHAAMAVRMIGYTELAEKIEERLIAVRISRSEGMIAVAAPYSPEFVNLMHGIQGAYFARKPVKKWLMPDTAEAAPKLFAALKVCYPGEAALGPKGVFTIQG
jgi:hypothetical protein